MYPEEMCKPMREDLTSVGFIELKTPEEVQELLEKKEGTVLLIVNSVCGCAAANARPAGQDKASSFENSFDVFNCIYWTRRWGNAKALEST